MFANLQYILQHNCRIELNKPVLMGVSGGPDSLCLLDLLWRLGYPVIVAHLNHGLRPSADVEAEIVRQEAENRHLQVIFQEINVSEYAQDRRISIEEAARTVRYQFLFEQARHVDAQAVLVAHTADDQVETVLMHLLRGSGMGGLQGMPYRAIPNSWDTNIPLIRPLLGFWRVEIQSYLDERGIQPVLDESNQDTDFFRNRLRHELIPLLEGYNPRIKQVIIRMTEIMKGDNEIIERAVDSAWDDCYITTGMGYIGLHFDRLLKLPIAIQRGIFRKGIGLIRAGSKDIDFDVIDHCLDYIRDLKAGKVNLFAGISIWKENKYLWLAYDEAELPTIGLPQLLAGEERWLELPGICDLNNDWVFSADYVRAETASNFVVEENQDTFQAWVNADQISDRIHLRNRIAGDRFQPLGMSAGSIKISDFMINHKIPLRMRNFYPLVLSGDEIVWVPGFQIGHAFRVTPGTRRIVHFQLRCMNDDNL